jgi:hypothetical protein
VGNDHRGSNVPVSGIHSKRFFINSY